MATYPSIASGLQYAGGLTSPQAYDPTVDTITMRATVRDASRVFLRMYDAAGQYMYAREASNGGSGDVWSYTASYVDDGDNQIMKVVFTGTPTGGSFRLNINGIETSNIGYNDTPSRKATIIGQHPHVGTGNVSCTWNAGTKTLYIEFVSYRAHMRLFTNDRIAVGANNLTGTNPKFSIATDQLGTGDLPKRQAQFFWDMVGVDSTYAWSGSVAGRVIGGSLPSNAIGPAQATLWLDFSVGIASTTPANAGSVNSPTPLLSWTYTSGTIGQIPIAGEVVTVTDSSDNVVFTKATVNGGSDSVRVPLSAGLINGQTYTWTLVVTKASGRTTTETRTFTVSYTRPAKHTCTALVNTDGHKITLSFSPSGISSSIFVKYVAKVRPAGAAEDGPLNVEVWSMALQSRTYGFVLRFPRNRDIILSFYVRQLQFGSEVDSLPHEIALNVKLDSLIVLNPVNHDYVLMRTHSGRGYGPQAEPEYTPIWGQPYPLYDPPVDIGVTIDATATEEFSYSPVIYPRLYSWYINTLTTSYILSDAMGNVWDVAVNPPYQRIPGGRRPFEIDCSFRQVGTNHFGELS